MGVRRDSPLACWLGVFLLCACCVLVGCTDAPKQPVALTMWHVYGSQATSPMNDLVERFNQSVGREQGIHISVTLVANSGVLHDALVASTRKAQGAGEPPDLFVCYPKTILAIGAEQVIDWNTWFSEAERQEFVPQFLEEGQIDGRQTVFPIAKSSNVLLVNATLFDSFSAATGFGYENLHTWEGLFATAKAYYQWSGGKAFFMHDDWMHYAMLNVESLGAPFFVEERVNFADPAFRETWMPLAKSALEGEVWLMKGFASSAMMTGEIVCGLESTASILYYKDNVTLPDNSTLPLTLKVAPPPLLKNGKALAILRGAGLGALKSTPEKEQAAAVFCKWLTEVENNLPFVISAGYMPVKKAAYQSLLEDESLFFPDQRYRSLYDAIRTMHEEYSFFVPPLFSSYSAVEKNFSTATLAVLKEFRDRRVQGNEELDDLAEKSLYALEVYMNQKVLRGH